MFEGAGLNLQFGFILQAKNFRAGPISCNHLIDQILTGRQTLICLKVASKLFFWQSLLHESSLRTC